MFLMRSSEPSQEFVQLELQLPGPALQHLAGREGGLPQQSVVRLEGLGESLHSVAVLLQGIVEPLN